VGFVLLAIWLGVAAWAEIERSRWLAQAGEPAATEASPAAESGWADLELAHAWYRDYTGGDAMVPDSAEGLASYVRDTEEFVGQVEAALGKEELRADADDATVAELAACVQQALTARVRHFAAQPGGMRDALAALDLYFCFVESLPSDSVPRAEVRAQHFADAVALLRSQATRPEFPIAEARPVFDRHLQSIESLDDLHEAIGAERDRRVAEVVATLEPGALDEGWLRPRWRALVGKGEFAPLRYREERSALRTLDALDETVDLPLAQRAARVEELPPDPVVARMAVLFAQRPELQAAARITRLGLAAIEYRRSEGAWPMDPSSLEGRFEAGLPVDPYTGQLFPFHRSDTELYLAPSRPLKAAEWSLPSAP